MVYSIFNEKTRGRKVSVRVRGKGEIERNKVQYNGRTVDSLTCDMRSEASSSSSAFLILIVTDGVLMFLATLRISFNRGTPSVTFLAEIPYGVRRKEEDVWNIYEKKDKKKSKEI